MQRDGITNAPPPQKENLWIFSSLKLTILEMSNHKYELNYKLETMPFVIRVSSPFELVNQHI